MKTRSVPAIIMLLAGFIAAVAGIVAHMEVADFMKMLLIVLILFYVFGSIVKVIIDHNFKEMQDEQTTDGEAEETEEEPSAAEDEEAAVDEDK
ncbi:MAG: hypothetical protein ACLT3H_10850 [Roseburia sp.]